jgi:hypothetical protein
MRQRLQTRCPADWGQLVRYSLRSAMAGTMKTKKCSEFKKVVAQFESEPATATLSEFSEIQSLTQYTCALEAKEKLKSEFATVIAARDCHQTQRLLAEGRDIIDANMKAALQKQSKEICCPEYGLGKECLTFKVGISRFVTKLEEKGCTMGGTPEAKTARAMHLMARANIEDGAGIDLKANGARLDRIWARIETLRKEDCSCQKNEVVSAGACTCQLYVASDPPRCLDREAAIRVLQEGLQALGCQVGSADGKLGDKVRGFIARLRTFDQSITDKELTPASFPRMAQLLQGKSKPDGKRLCADYAVEEKLSRDQRRAFERKDIEQQNQPYAAIAVASTCNASSCEWASATGQPDAETAQRKAVEACQQKAKSCVPAAGHRQGGAR